ncbi:hypothetical protein PTSG_07830 [Salpingoeca rosetta]|uniref:Peptidase S54 rhomboid domain-containing protein n=1 Tax=Salpingoeca rosetta (strain ATCC 50818 / BSB-021) TaxID=946362 RepID=F2UGG3_SALR5|nr:uncharacterized protein PTSG_07830 [Salpingoeca rosetta]EGD75713.1 hypothetical protein PTSG_07830 [Salpingoeca rosetta]|eukprot:XP_004991634.1 hypothetical protein PTSG_07830 [Salpingoeca rosetta]
MASRRIRRRSSFWGGQPEQVEPGTRLESSQQGRVAAQIGATMKRGGARVANGMARWFGVAGDNEDARYRHYQYQQHKIQQQQARRNEGQGRLRGEQGQGNLEQLNDILESSDEDSDYDADKHEHDMIYNVDEGLLHYRQLRDEENRKIVKPGWFGGQVNRNRQSVHAAGLADLRRKTKHRRVSRVRRDTLVQAQLEAMPTYSPIFIEIITFVQVLVFVFLFAYAYTQNEIAEFGFTDNSVTCAADTTPQCELFNGTLNIGSVATKKRNFLYGPTDDLLLGVGAKFSACMRDDSELRKDALATRAKECGPGRDPPNTCEGGTEGYGCCTLDSGRAGMTSRDACMQSGGTWEDRLCTSADFVYIRPCCGVGGYAKCAIMTENECDFQGGTWQIDQVLCSETLCLADTCQIDKVGLGVTADPEVPNLPKNPNQWFRLFTSLFIHAGAIQLVIIMSIQWYAGRQIETQAGFLRTFLVYFISGVGGTTIAAIFSPNLVTTGANPAVYGLLGCVLVELLQTWQLLEKPWLQLLKLVAIIAFLLLVGTLPFLDNWSHVGGFAFGVVAGIVFLPYITFGEWDVARKRLLFFVCFPLLIGMFIAAFVTFYQIQNTNFCSWCDYVNCIPYSPDLSCNT